MSLLFVDGFDHYATADILKKWTDRGGSGSITTTASRHDTGRGFSGSGSNAWLLKGIANQATIVLGTAFRSSSLSTSATQYAIQFSEGSTVHGGILFTASGQIEYYRGPFSTKTLLGTTSAAGVASNAWIYIEVKVTIHDSTGIVQIYVNSVQKLNLSSQDTQNGGTGVVNVIQVGAQSTATHSYDDLFISDGNLLGDVKVEILRPNADGTYSQFTPSTGTSHYQLVDEDTPNLTDYNESDVTNEIDTYNFENLSGSGTIHALAGNVMMYSPNGTKEAAPYIKSGSTEQAGATVQVTTSEQNAQKIWETNPDTTNPWTSGGVNAVEFGAKVIS